MVDIALLIEEEVKRVQEEVDKEVIGAEGALLGLLLKYSSESEQDVVNDNGETEKQSRTTVGSNKERQMLRDIDKLKNDLSNEFYESVTAGIESAIALTATYMATELGYKNKYKLNAQKSFIEKVIVGDRTLRQSVDIAMTNMFYDIERAIKSGIIGNVDISVVSKEVQKFINSNKYHLDTIVLSEIFTAYRLQGGITHEKNGYTWVKIHEHFPRHPNRKRHKCYELAHIDKYGKGLGVYKTTDSIVYFPHPNCTSWIEFLKEVD